MHTLIAEIFATSDMKVRVVTNAGEHIFDSLPQAEEFCFGLGADTVASVKDRVGYLRATKYETPTHVKGVCKLGHGTKLHTAYKSLETGFVQPYCGCSGTSNNHMRATGFWVGIAPTCKNSLK